jgi:DEAD/DEAH box helicase domain-containing protein
MTDRDFAPILSRLTADAERAGCVAHVEELPARVAAFGELVPPPDARLREALAARGIDHLYRHQADAIEKIRAGKSVVVVTGTASGKTVCYHLPVLEDLLADPLATALMIYPTKALTQDQLKGLTALAGDIPLAAGAFDGDTPQNLRRNLRDRGSVILTNPDMLHSGILPNHSRWGRFFSHLKTVVIDEVHAYRGVFGSHLANVIRRLQRICRHYGSNPRFVACSATIENPGEHASGITGVPMEVVSEDGSPRGPKKIVLVNPPPLVAGTGAATGGDRKSALGEVVRIFTALVKEGIQTIAFTPTRLSAELVHKNSRELLLPISRRLADSIRAYRGGYLPEERREIERQLAARELLGVASTNALELGIDIGSLEACVMLGYPGTVASLWQQAGRAGRGRSEALVFLVARNTPVDQFLAGNARWLFDKSPERAVTDPDNPHVSVGHLRCAVHELPVDLKDAALFGPLAEPILDLLEEEQTVKRIDDRWYFASSIYPAAEVSLRNIAGPVVTIEDVESQGKVIGTLDELAALSQLHDHAVYLHGGETWFVNELDLTQKIARVTRRELDYYTQAVSAAQIRIDEKEEEAEDERGLLGFGDVTVTTTIPMFKKVRFGSRESVGFEKLELPPQELETTAMWFAPSREALDLVLAEGLLPAEALIGIGNVLVEVAPVFLMCDPRDIGAVVDSSQLGREALFLHDRYPGGLGYAAGVRERFAELLSAVTDVIRDCACEDGCPSCVGSAVPPFAMTDLDTSVRGRIPDKRAAAELLQALSGAVSGYAASGSRECGWQVGHPQAG